MSSVGTKVPVPRKEQVLPQGTQSPEVGESEKKRIQAKLLKGIKITDQCLNVSTQFLDAIKNWNIKNGQV